MGAHSIDLINFMIGKIKFINSFKTNQMRFYKVEDINIVNFQTDKNILGQASWCSTSPFKVDEFKIYGRKGTISFSMNLGEQEYVIIKLKDRIIKKIKMAQPLHKNMFSFFIDEPTQLNKRKSFLLIEWYI